MPTIDGLTLEEVKWNIYAFGADMRKFARKRDAARKDHTRAHWQKKCDEAAHFLDNNQKRLARFETAQQSVQRTHAPWCESRNGGGMCDCAGWHPVSR